MAAPSDIVWQTTHVRGKPFSHAFSASLSKKRVEVELGPKKLLPLNADMWFTICGNAADPGSRSWEEPLPTDARCKKCSKALERMEKKRA